MRTKLLTLIALTAFAASLASAHDTWVQTNVNVIRTVDIVHIDFMLGNHGNDHRDFKLAGKPDLESSTLEIIGPDDSKHDLKPTLIDQGYAPKEGYYSATFRAPRSGLYLIAHKSDKVVSYAPTRSIKSAKAFFVASTTLDAVPEVNPGFDRVLGHPLELVPLTNPVTPMGTGRQLIVKLLYKGKPLSNTRISFIPRGQKLAEGFDEKFERTTDTEGRATFEPTDANLYLVVAHHEAATEKGDGYTSTKYSATMTMYVPAICPCCGD